MSSERTRATPRSRALLAPIEKWPTADETGDPRQSRHQTALEMAAERRELRRARRLYAVPRDTFHEPPGEEGSAERRVHLALLYANGRRCLRFNELVRRTGLPPPQLLAAVRRRREQGYVQFGVEGRD